MQQPIHFVKKKHTSQSESIHIKKKQTKYNKPNRIQTRNEKQDWKQRTSVL